jgi:hypothetical protein
MTRALPLSILAGTLLMMATACTGTVVCASESCAHDSGAHDSGALDSGALDSGALDSGTLDSGTLDSGTLDSGTLDSGTLDSGTLDSGALDSGALDSGALDSGALPLWRRGLALNQWSEIPGTSGAGGAAVDAWGALAENKTTAELYIAASGGHSDSSDNRVVSISLMVDAPAWVLRHVSSPNPVADVLYYPDGLPTSRHLYHHLHYLPAFNAVLLGGCRFGFGGGTPTGPGMDAFDLSTNKWLPRNTFADITPFNEYVVEIDQTGAAWTPSGLRFVASTNTWSKPGTGVGLGRFPHATAPARSSIFSLQFGDGQGFDLNLGVVARRLNTTTGNSEAITFNPSPALTQFTAAQPNYAGMDYDAANDRFLFYSGGEPGTVYVITPNTSTTWDISLLPTTGVPGAPGGAGVNKRFRYLPSLAGFVLLPRSGTNLFFLRTR